MQRCLADAPLPDLVVVAQEKPAFLARTADQQWNVAGGVRGRRVEGLRRQVGPVHRRAEIVAVEQWQRRTPDRARRRRDCSREPLGRNLVQPVEVAARDAEFVQHGFGQRAGALAPAYPDRGAALDHGAVEQAARRRHGQQDADLPAAARLAEDRHVAGIAAEPLDIVAHPFERGDEVEHAGIAGLRVALAADIGEVRESRRCSGGG